MCLMDWNSNVKSLTRIPSMNEISKWISESNENAHENIDAM